MNIPENLKYTNEHEWVLEDTDTMVVGITDYAQSELGDIVYIELPNTGDKFTRNDVFGSIEAVKAAADIYCPVSGEVVDVNSNLKDAPESINKDPYGEGWIIKLRPENKDELSGLMDSAQYTEYISKEE
jgi:glycine cleavage system H protein